MGFFRVSQVEDKEWMIARLADMPGWREVGSFDAQQARQYNAELAARLDELEERAAKLRFHRNRSWTKLRFILKDQIQAKPGGNGTFYGGNTTITRRLIDGDIANSRRRPLGVAVLAGALALYASLVIGGLITGTTWLPWVLLGVPAGLAILALAALPYIYWRSSQLVEMWFRGVFGLVSGDGDYAKMSRDEAIAMLNRRWKHLNEPALLVKVIQQFLREFAEAPGHSAVLVMTLARLGYAAEYVTKKETFGFCLRALRLVQGAYPSWEAMAQDVDKAWRRWAENRSDPDDAETVSKNIVYLREHVWPKANFKMSI